MPESPFRRLRRERGWSLVKAARVAGVSPSAWYLAEHGVVRSPRRLLDALARLGYDRAAIEREYRDWQDWQGAESA